MFPTPNLRGLHRVTRFFLVVFLVAWICMTTVQAADPIDLRFDKIPLGGIYPDTVLGSVLQDRHGFLWIGTTQGVFRYDGHNTKLYQHNPDDPNSLSGDDVGFLVQDRYGTIWFSVMNGGLCSYDPETQKFTRHHPDPYDPHDSDYYSAYVYIDRTGTLWAGTFGGGLKRYDHKAGRFFRYMPEYDFPKSLSHAVVIGIYEDRSGVLWVGTLGGGLNRFSRETEEFTQYRHDPNDPGSISSDAIYLMLEDHTGNFWVSTWEDGLNRFDKETGRWIHYRHDPEDPNSISSNSTKILLEDHSGNLWITSQNGLNLYDRPKDQFVSYYHDPLDPYSLSSNIIYTINEDQSGILWVSTQNALNRLDLSKSCFNRYIYMPKDQQQQKIINVLALEEDGRGHIWIGTRGDGLYIVDPKSKTVTNYNDSSQDHHGLQHSVITSICADQQGEVWVGTNNKGFYHFNQDKKKFDRIYLDLKSSEKNAFWEDVSDIFESSSGYLWLATDAGPLLYDRVTQTQKPIPWEENTLPSAVTMYFEDHSGILWAGTTNSGLVRLDARSRRLVSYLKTPEDLLKMKMELITDIIEDASGNLWISSYGDGLFKFDTARKNVKRYHLKDGLTNTQVAAIIEDNGMLWISTEGGGLFCFDPNTEQFEQFGIKDGLESNNFFTGSKLKTLKGELIFGNNEGITRFHPEAIQRQGNIPLISFTDFLINGRSVPIGELPDGRCLLSKSIIAAPDISLSYKDRFFSIRFAALDFSSPQHNQYRYKMEGLDKDWIFAGNEYKATYTNIPSGNYIFRVKGANSNGVWNEKGASMKITVTPPFWQTWWFRITGSVFFIALIFMVTQLRTLSARKKALILKKHNIELNLQKEKAERAEEKAKQATKFKSEFLANMSHEIRTPMNAIMGMSYLGLQSEILSKQHNYFSKIQSSANLLLGIINDILDFSKIEAGKLQFEIKEFSLDDVMENLSNFISYKAGEKGIEVLFDIDPEVPRFLSGDQLRLGQVLINLANNAVKFTHEGEILVSVKLEKKDKASVKLKFSVKDTGIGLTKEQTDKLFEAFSQADGSITRKYGGTGLGLTISKKLVEMMHGQIKVKSVPEKGSIFSFTAAFGKKEDTKPKEMLKPPDDLIGLKALVVDDSTVSQEILKNILESFSFEVDTVDSGSDAIEKLKQASKEKPYELVLMDWRMPGMDGIQTTKKIKADSDLEKIPQILMVTAYGREEVMHKAENAGLDGFLIKPVNSSILFNTILEAFGHEFVREKLVSKEGFVKNKEFEKIQGAKILLVEDNEINQEVAVELLENNGFWVSVAEDGEKAVQMVSEYSFDAVLMDLQMPVMDGYAATKEIRKRETEEKRLPVIAMTADAVSGVKEDVMEAGMDDYVTKPIDHEKLFLALIKWIHPGERKKYVQAEFGKSDKAEQTFSKLADIDIVTGIARIGGSQASYKKLLKKFHKNNLNTIVKVKEALDNNDIDLAKRLVHTLKGVSGTIGADKIYNHAKNLETAIKKQDGNLYPEMLENLRESLDQAFIAIESLETKETEPLSEKKLDKSKTALIINELKQLLKDDDTEATRCLSSLKEELKGLKLKKELDQIEELIDSYDFEEALKVLKQISQRFN